MWLLHELYEAEGHDMTDKSKEEDGRAPSNQHRSPDTRQSNDALGIVEVAVYPTVGELRTLVKEEVSEEPAKLAK